MTNIPESFANQQDAIKFEIESERPVFVVRYTGFFSAFIERRFLSMDQAQRWVRQVGVSTIATISEEYA